MAVATENQPPTHGIALGAARKVLQRAFLSVVRAFYKKGNLQIIMPGGDRHIFGGDAAPPIVVHVRRDRAIRRMLTDTSLGFAESFMDGDVDLVEGDLLELMRLTRLNGNHNQATSILSGARVRLSNLLRRAQQINTLGRSRDNVHHHYDLPEEFYRLFLDPDMQYSCAYYEDPEQSLEQAQLNKKRHVAAKLCLQPSQSILDIGSGWGGLALYLARCFDVTVKGVTLSEEQLSVSRARALDAELNSRVRFELQDYRDLDQQFDAIMSVGMFEHVGINYYASFFKKASELLKPNGVMLLHTIGRSGPPASTDAFIRKYVFPGGYIPSLSEVVPHIEAAGLIITDVEVLRLHYAETLKNWRARFTARRNDALAMTDERFCRMWELYLAASESAFRWGDLCVFQIQLAKNASAVPMTRDYISHSEDTLRKAEDLQRAG